MNTTGYSKLRLRCDDPRMNLISLIEFRQVVLMLPVSA